MMYVNYTFILDVQQKMVKELKIISSYFLLKDVLTNNNHKQSII